MCNHPAIAARDVVLAELYRSALQATNDGSLRATQRRWLADLQSCRDPVCVANAYDARIGSLMRSGPGRRLGETFAFEHGADNGELLIVQHGDWVAFALDKTEIGPQGEAGGDVYPSSLTGMAHLSGDWARGGDALGCRVALRHVPSGWQVRQLDPCRDAGTATFDGMYLAGHR